MSILSVSSRHRKLLFMAAAVAASGYASYHFCTSAAFERRRKRLHQVWNTLTLCLEAASQSAESLSILSTDLKSFLLSDDDTVPRSLQQALKISHSEEFQETVTVLSAALIRGLRRGMETKSSNQLHGHSKYSKPRFPNDQENEADFVSEDLDCREIREVSFTAKRQDESRLQGQKECMMSTVQKTSMVEQEWERKSYSSGSDILGQRSKRVGIVFDKWKRAKPTEDLWDRLLSKLFSETGVDFACAVSGTFARSLVVALFDTSHKQQSPRKSPASSFSSMHQDTHSQIQDESLPNHATIVDLLATHKYRMLMAEYLQTLISTAVTIYIDKTKDVNVYDDVVASIVNPSHKDSMKELLTSVCNNAIETLVRTSFDVFKNGQAGASKCHQQVGSSQWVAQECSSLTARNSPTNIKEDDKHDGTRAGHSIYKLCDSWTSSCMDSIEVLHGANAAGALSVIDGVTKTLAIPSNRKLIVDVAGTMTSEAVKSFANVVISTASSHISNTMNERWNKLRNYFSDHRGLKLQERLTDMAAKTYVLASVCLALCLHVLAGSQVLQI